MNTLNFLKNLQLNTVVSEEKQSASRPKIERNPTNGASLRLFKDGSIYPSQDIVTRHNLEYVSKGSEANANGYDVTNSKEWIEYPNTAPAVLFISTVPKNSPKVSLFGQTEYNADKTPVSTVMNQKVNTFGKQLIATLQEVYSVELFTENNYVDLVINEDYPVTNESGIYHLPKIVSRGADKGKPTYVKRENITLYPLTIFTPETQASVMSEDVVDVTEDQEEVSQTENETISL